MLLDVRTPEEYRENHHDGAVNIPLDTIDTHPFTIPFDEPLEVHCQSGARANSAVAMLKQRGFTNVSMYQGTGAF